MRSWPCPWGISWQGRTDSGKQRVWKEGPFRTRLCLCRLKLTLFGRGKTENGSVRGHFDGPRRRRQRPWRGGRDRASRHLGIRIPRTAFPRHCASVTGDCVHLAVPGLPQMPSAGLVCKKDATPRSVNILSQLTVPRGSICLSSTPHFVLVEKWKTRFTIYYLWC